MPDYKNGKIYKLHILSNDNLIYYGSTVETLSNRLAKHRASYNYWKKVNKYFTTSFNLFNENYDNVVITLIENYPCNSKDELKMRERYYIENNKCLNKIIPSRTIKEWCEVNKDKIKQYYKNNKNKYLKQKQEYYKTNKEKILKKKKEYREDNKEKISEKKKVKMECPFCKSVIRKSDIKKHQRTKKCLTFQNI